MKNQLSQASVKGQVSAPPTQTAEASSAAPQHQDVVAIMAADTGIQCGRVIETFSKDMLGTLGADIDLAALKSHIEFQAAMVADGRLEHLEGMLVAQAMSLQAVYSNFVTRAEAQHRTKDFESFMVLGLKAQAQSRATIQALIELKFPKQPATFIKQANVAHGPQQVNNQGAEPARTGKTRRVIRDKVIVSADGSKNLDAGATATTARGDSSVEAVGVVNRPTKRRG